jgi:hypothetical protein
MKTALLQGAILDYWTARAEGIPAGQLEIRPIQRNTECHCVRKWHTRDPIIGPDLVVLDYSTNWARGGPLIEKYCLDVARYGAEWAAYTEDTRAFADTPLQAICRAVVRAAFGDEVQEVAPCST